MNIPLMRPCIEDDDLQVMNEAVSRGLVSQGSLTRALEDNFTSMLNVSGSVATNSGTSALVLALRTLRVGPGDQVIIPSYTCVAVLNAVLQVGAEPCLVDNVYDIHGMDFNLSINGIRKHLTRKTKVIIVPHMFGVPAQIDKILEFGVPVIEDGTLCLGAKYEDRLIGSWGQIGVFSLHISKMIAAGEGGILVTNTGQLYERARYLNSCEEDQPRQRLQDENKFEFELRYNFRLTDIHAALALNQLRKLPMFLLRRRELAQRYTKRLSIISHLNLPAVKDNPNVFQRFLLGLTRSDPVDVIRKYLLVGIEVGRGVFPPVHRFLRLSPNDYPLAERAIHTLISLPLYPDLREAEVEHILQESERILGVV